MSNRKSLFDENDKYTDKGLEVSHDVYFDVLAVIRKYSAQGYSYREIAGIAHGAVELGLISMHVMLVEAECCFGLNLDSDLNDTKK